VLKRKNDMDNNILRLKRRMNFDLLDKYVNKFKFSEIDYNTPFEDSLINISRRILFELSIDLSFNSEDIKPFYTFFYTLYYNDLKDYYDKKMDKINNAPSDTIYTFIQHSGINPDDTAIFKKDFYYFEDLFDEYKNDLNINWKYVKTNLDIYSNITLPILKIGDKNNNYGFNFSIKKEKIK
jgi:hypothetical protein